MLCTNCKEQSDGTEIDGPSRRRPLRFAHDWTCLENLICERCGTVLPPGQPETPDHRAKASQLDRFGLAGNASTLLEP